MLTPPNKIEYQWGTVSVCGDKSLGNITEFEKNGWRRVPASRHPEFGSKDPNWIIDGAMVLMERPLYLSERARHWESQKADAQILNITGLSYIDEESVTLPKVNGRIIDLNASNVRKTTIKERIISAVWRLKVWLRTKFDLLRK